MTAVPEPGNSIDLTDLEPDNRYALVMWPDGEDFPKVHWSGCASSFEAWGLLEAGADALSRVCRASVPEIEDAEDDDD